MKFKLKEMQQRVKILYAS